MLFRSIGEVAGVSDTVNDDKALVGAPCGQILQDGQEWTETGAAREKPEVFSRREVINGQEAITRLLYANRITLAHSGQQFGKSADRNEYGEEFEVFIMRRRRDREWPPDDVGVSAVEADPCIVSGREPKAWRTTGAERQKLLRPMFDREYSLVLRKYSRRDGLRA